MYDGPETSMIQGGYANEAKMAIQPTMKQRIDMAIRQAEERLSAAKRARELFGRNPELEELLNIMRTNPF